MNLLMVYNIYNFSFIKALCISKYPIKISKKSRKNSSPNKNIVKQIAKKIILYFKLSVLNVKLFVSFRIFGIYLFAKKIATIGIIVAKK